ncbi:CDP-glycerol glycerophosphotransferase family protein [Actinomadura yumaensis]|uniref:bifunctional glycosyltransferase/CDP-glycerol:glycerophosphate glycerophosphotransferase n=1 Tax=Actinomadura yumaensis TaxID=111807 RepID=UPI0036230B7C
MSPTVSVVVPIYNVEPYLRTCLESLAAQTLRDLDVVMVDDGSSDGSGAIAAAFAERDGRFRLVTRENGGLGAARNTGIAEAAGEYLAFVDSDDLLPPYALEYLAASLAETGSDLATGNVRRFDGHGVAPSPMHRKIFRTPEPRTHVTRDTGLLTDRLVTNKLWRRSFWDAQGMAFPEGVLHEDIVVALTGHFCAAAVDKLSHPVYLWRVRPDGDKSITQDRVAGQALEHRVRAVRAVGGFLAERGMDAQRLLWDRVVVGDDLRLFLQEMDAGDDGYRTRFLDLANAYLDDAVPGVLDDLPAIERLKWHLVRRRMVPELLEVLTFQKSREMAGAGVVRKGRHYYGRYPFLDDPAVGVPREVYRLREEVGLRQKVEAVRWEDGRLVVEGRAALRYLPPNRRWKQQVFAWLVNADTGRRLPLPTACVRRTAAGADGRSRDWGGFRVTVDPRRLTGKADGPGEWGVELWVLNRGHLRRAELGPPASGPAQRPGHREIGGGARVCPEWSESGGLVVRVERRCATVTRVGLDGAELVLAGEIAAAGAGGGDEPGARPRELTLTRAPGGFPRRYPLAYADEPGAEGEAGTGEAGTGEAADGRAGVWRFTARVPVDDLGAGAPGPFPPMSPEARALGDGAAWAVRLAGGRDGDLAVRLAGSAPRPRFPRGPEARREVAVHRTARGLLELRERAVCPVLDSVNWTGDGRLVLGGDLPLPDGVPAAFVIAANGRAEETVLPLGRIGQRFTVEFSPGRVASLAGVLPLPAGGYRLAARVGEGADAADAPAQVDETLHERLPARCVVDGRAFTLTDVRGESPVLTAENDLLPDERGRRAQDDLRDGFYPRVRAEPLRRAVLFESYFGRQYSDSPRAVLEELRRRDAPFEYLWVVDNGQAEVPDGVTPVRRLGRDHFEALARSEYVVVNSHLPSWFEARPEQTVVQTWHGNTLKRIGFDIEKVQFATRDYHERLAGEVGQWDYLVSPSPWCTSVLRRAFRFKGRCWRPATRATTCSSRRNATRSPPASGPPSACRRRKVALYAPTWRDDKFYRRGKYRLDLRLDLEALWRELGEEYAVLVRRHPNIVDRVPEAGRDFVFDVSLYPEMQELLLVADVLVTDYSSAMFDFAVTGRPMLFFTYDLESYRDSLRGFYFDFEAEAPGPLLSTSAQVVDALKDLDAVADEHAAAYRAFTERHCPLDDGKATIRVVERVFGGAL